MTSDTLEFSQDSSNITGTPRNFDLHQFLNRLNIAEVTSRSGYVVHPICQQNNLGPVTILTQLLNATMDVSDHTVSVDNAFPVKSEYNTKHTVRAGVLRAHIEDQLVGVESLTDSPW
jgi:hypothetical protein